MKGVIRGHGDKRTFFLDGKQVTREEFDSAFPDTPIGDGSGLIGWKPLISDALAVHPRQIKEAREDAIKKGVPVDFTADGRPKFTSRQQRSAYLRAYGFFDKSAGYGDPADGSFKGDRPDPVDTVKEICDAVGCRIDKKAQEAMVREIMTGRRD
jgi:hypothetical protein